MGWGACSQGCPGKRLKQAWEMSPDAGEGASWELEGVKGRLFSWKIDRIWQVRKRRHGG